METIESIDVAEKMDVAKNAIREIILKFQEETKFIITDIDVNQSRSSFRGCGPADIVSVYIKITTI